MKIELNDQEAQAIINLIDAAYRPLGGLQTALIAAGLFGKFQAAQVEAPAAPKGGKTDGKA